MDPCLDETKRKSIEKPWAVYSEIVSPIGIGRIVRELPGYLEIISSDKQAEPIPWDPKYVKRFDTPAQAVLYFMQHSDRYSGEKTEKAFWTNFSSLVDNHIVRVTSALQNFGRAIQSIDKRQRS